MGRPTLLVAVAILIVFLWLFVPYNLLNQHLPWHRGPEKPQDQTASPPPRPENRKRRSCPRKWRFPSGRKRELSPSRLSDLKEKLRIDYEYDAQEGVLTIRQGKVQLTMLREAPGFEPKRRLFARGGIPHHPQGRDTDPRRRGGGGFGEAGGNPRRIAP